METTQTKISPGLGILIQSRWGFYDDACLTLMHLERPKLYAILAFLSAIGLKKKKTEDKHYGPSLSGFSFYSKSGVQDSYFRAVTPTFHGIFNKVT